MGCLGSKAAGAAGGGKKWDKPNPIATFDTTMGTFKVRASAPK